MCKDSSTNWIFFPCHISLHYIWQRSVFGEKKIKRLLWGAKRLSVTFVTMDPSAAKHSLCSFPEQTTFLNIRLTSADAILQNQMWKASSSPSRFSLKLKTSSSLSPRIISHSCPLLLATPRLSVLRRGKKGKRVKVGRQTRAMFKYGSS